MFIDEWFEKDYYKQLPLGYHVQSSYQPSQFFWTHLLYTVENLELWRAVLDPNEPTKTIATDFRITTAGRDASSVRYLSQCPTWRQMKSSLSQGRKEGRCC